MEASPIILFKIRISHMNRILITLFCFLISGWVLAGEPIEISFQNGDVKLVAFLEEPEMSYDKIVILIPGAGADDHLCHPMLAAHLLEQGIAVCRFDDRGVGQSEGKQEMTTIGDVASDVAVLFTQLRADAAFAEKAIGFIGHDEGGFAALETLNLQVQPDFLILLATPAMTGERIIFAQTQFSLRDRWQFGTEEPLDTRRHLLSIHEILRQGLPKKETKKAIQAYLKSAELKAKPGKFLHPNYLYFVDFDPTPILQTLKVPTLYLIGEADEYIQAKQNTKRIWLTGNALIEYESLPGLKHYLQPEGETLEAISPDALNRISSWLESRE